MTEFAKFAVRLLVSRDLARSRHGEQYVDELAPYRRLLLRVAEEHRCHVLDAPAELIGQLRAASCDPSEAVIELLFAAAAEEMSF